MNYEDAAGTWAFGIGLFVALVAWLFFPFGIAAGLGFGAAMLVGFLVFIYALFAFSYELAKAAWRGLRHLAGAKSQNRKL